MRVEFEKIIISNFLSIGQAEISLDSNGYVLVSGVNNCSVDDAKSNGSGKSSIWEALSWVLTGTTTRGLKNVSNIYGDDGALVELFFRVDDTEYHLIRSKDHSELKTNLKLYINETDKSGKGLRDTEEILKKYLPYLNAQLINSVIILGQGLPQRFSNNTPSGRKAVLESLSETDFMLVDLKTRIGQRKEELSKDLRENEDERLSLKTKLSQIDVQFEETCSILDNLEDEQSIKDAIKEIKEQITTISTERESLSEIVSADEDEVNKYRTEYSEVSFNQNNEIEQLKKSHDETYQPEYEVLANLRAERSTLNNEIVRLKSVKTVCPTCGQKLPNVSVIDTTLQEQRVKELDDVIKQKSEHLSQLIDLFQAKQKSITEKYSEQKNQIQKTAEDIKTRISINNARLKEIDAQYLTLSTKQNNLETELKYYTERKKELKDTKARLEETKEKTQEEILYIETKIDNLKARLDIITKFSSATSRDFRGYLLIGVINYINTKAKEYSEEVFGTSKLALAIDGNDIVISYNDKQYESLSGGEKQKVDIILQLAIRDMLCQYAGFSSNIIVIDEIFDNLDAIGCQKVLNLFARKLQDVSSVYIISHHSDDLEIPYDKEIVVTKDDSGISTVR